MEKRWHEAELKMIKRYDADMKIQYEELQQQRSLCQQKVVSILTL